MGRNLRKLLVIALPFWFTASLIAGHAWADKLSSWVAISSALTGFFGFTMMAIPSMPRIFSFRTEVARGCTSNSLETSSHYPSLRCSST